ncbi:MAG: NAD-dependent epimerase/dehydratase family protein [Chloroflexi bacterium]|nr:NAD-dependent epimerase/dehydratase family protein [Chloroflexota bacterium]
MRVLVTGGAGFIGSRVVNKLCDYGVTVRVFDLSPPLRDDVDYYQGSILEIGELRSAMQGVDAVMHLAAVADVKDVFDAPHHSEMVNVRGTANVLEAMRLNRIPRLVYGSTTWVYEAAVPEVVDESTPLGSPAHLYTATKMAGEYYCRSYASLYDMEPTVLRYGIPYGPGSRPAGVIALFTEKALRGEALTIAGDGMQFRKFVYVDDLAEGNVLALQPSAINGTYNLDGAEKITIRQLAETIQKILGNVTIEYIPARPGDFPGKDVRSDKALSELGWKSKTSLEEGIRQYIDWSQGRKREKEERWAKVDKRLMP